MRVSSSIPDAPPAELRFRRRISVVESARELWRAREFVRALFERQLRARYKQAFLGFAWAIIPPLIFMVVLTTFVQHAVNIPTGGIPYPLFSYVALVPWTFFSSAVSGGANSIVTSLDVMNKMYVPREVFPISTVLSTGVDALISLLGLGILFGVYSFARSRDLRIPACRDLGPGSRLGAAPPLRRRILRGARTGVQAVQASGDGVLRHCVEVASSSTGFGSGSARTGAARSCGTSSNG